MGMPHLPFKMKGYLDIQCVISEAKLSNLDCSNYDATDYTVPFYYLPSKAVQAGQVLLLSLVNAYEVIMMGSTPCLNWLPNLADIILMVMMLQPLSNVGNMRQ